MATEAKQLTYKNMKIEDVVEWCKANNQVDWLKKTAALTVNVKVYPKRINSKGKSVADKTKPYVLEERKINFLQIKEMFVAEFMPELKPEAKEKKPTLDEILASL